MNAGRKIVILLVSTFVVTATFGGGFATIALFSDSESVSGTLATAESYTTTVVERPPPVQHNETATNDTAANDPIVDPAERNETVGTDTGEKDSAAGNWTGPEPVPEPWFGNENSTHSSGPEIEHPGAPSNGNATDRGKTADKGGAAENETVGDRPQDLPEDEHSEDYPDSASHPSPTEAPEEDSMADDVPPIEKPSADDVMPDQPTEDTRDERKETTNENAEDSANEENAEAETGEQANGESVEEEIVLEDPEPKDSGSNVTETGPADGIGGEDGETDGEEPGDGAGETEDGIEGEDETTKDESGNETTEDKRETGDPEADETGTDDRKSIGEDENSFEESTTGEQSGTDSTEELGAGDTEEPGALGR